MTGKFIIIGIYSQSKFPKSFELTGAFAGQWQMQLCQ